MAFYDFEGNTKIHIQTKFGVSSTFKLILLELQRWNFDILTV